MKERVNGMNTRYCINFVKSIEYHVLLYFYKWKDVVENLNEMQSKAWIRNTKRKKKDEWKCLIGTRTLEQLMNK